MRGPIIAALFTAAVGVSACAVYDDFAYGRAYGYHGHRYGDYRYQAATIRAGAALPTRSRAAALPCSTRGWPRRAKARRSSAPASTTAAPGHLGAQSAHRANAWFRRLADQDGDLRLTDQEIRTALLRAAA
jgi:hypothetical protein